MYIEIKGIGFTNKGAELMLHAILQKIEHAYPDAKIVVKPEGGDTYYKRAELGLYHKLEYWKHKINYGRILGKILSKKMRISYGLIREEEIDLLLDASGLLYSQKFGIRSTIKTANQFKRMKKNGAQIILLPQAFGPFENPLFSIFLRKIYKYSDVIYARDQQSKEFFTEEIDTNEKIKIAPDFTNLIKPKVLKKYKERKDDICIIPNYRMIDKTDKVNDNSYKSLMLEIINTLGDRGENVFLLIHELGKDYDLADQIREESGYKLQVIKEEDPFKVKGIISQVKGVVSSRFHGAVNALSQGVPALSTSWHHKYAMLFRDYEFTDGIITPNITNKELSKKLDYICDREKRDHLAIKLNSVSSELNERTEKMWTDIFTLIK